MVPGGDQKAGRSGGWVIDGFADAGIDQLDDGADDVARGAELAECVPQEAARTAFVSRQRGRLTPVVTSAALSRL